MATNKIHSVAIFGAGRIGRVHARSIADHPAIRLKYVIDPAAGPAGELADLHGATVVDEATALADPAVAAILVASATDTHADLLQKGLTAGKAVFCEKPIDLSIERVDACLAAVKGAGAPLLLAFNRRFDPAVAEMKQRSSTSMPRTPI